MKVLLEELSSWKTQAEEKTVLIQAEVKAAEHLQQRLDEAES